MAKDTDWMSALMNPSKGSFMSWMRGQSAQYNPLIGLLKGQMQGMRPEKDFTVKAYEKLLGAQPSREGISGAYQTAAANLANYMRGLDTTRGAQGVSDIIGSVGAGLGISPGVSGDLAQAAGTLSGVGAAGGDVMSKAILSGATGQLAGLETQALADAAQRNQELTLGLGQAKTTAKAGQRDIARMIAELQGKKIGGRLNPLDVANQFMTFRQNQKKLADFLAGSSGRGGGTQTTQTPPSDTGIDFSSPPIASIASGLNSLIGSVSPGPRGINR